MNDDGARRIAATEALLRAAAQKSGFVVTADGRIGEQDAAVLIGYAGSTLKTMRCTFNSGPSWYRAPVATARVSYRLSDLARWIERRREEGL